MPTSNVVHAGGNEGGGEIVSKCKVVDCDQYERWRSKKGEEIVNKRLLFECEYNFSGKIPGGTLNTGGRAGQALVNYHLRGTSPAGSLQLVHHIEQGEAPEQGESEHKGRQACSKPISANDTSMKVN